MSEGVIKINDTNLFNDFRFTGRGSEGRVFKFDDNTVIKLYHQHILEDLRMQNKFLKIKSLQSKSISGYIFPRSIVINQREIPIGYLMDYVDKDEEVFLGNIYDENDKRYSFNERLKLLIEIEDLIKKGHVEGLVLLDIKSSNLLINKEGFINIVDTDNFKTSEYSQNIIPYYFEPYVREISEEIDDNIDKYAFGLFALCMLVKHSYNYPFPGYDEHGYIKDIYKYVKALDLDEEIKEVFYELFSDTRQKPYIGDCLKTMQKQKLKSLKLDLNYY
jgi:serine/threonine protein kinase